MRIMFTNAIVPFIPIALIFARFMLAIILFIDALDGRTNYWFSLGLSLGIGSDIIDGMIARKLGIADAHLRNLDSRVDFVFLTSIIVAAWIAHKDLLLPYQAALFTMLIIYAISILYPWIKFKRLPSYHAYSAKISGLFLFASAIELFALNQTTLLLISLGITIISHLDRIAISVLLPNWQSDVVGVWHAWQIRNISQT